MAENKKKPVSRVAVIHDLCSVGKAALTNILPVLSVMGIEACPLPTMILSTHTGGFGKPVMRALPAFPSQCGGHLKENHIEFDHIFIGYLGNPELIRNVEEFLRLYPDAKVLLDPIMADHGSFYSHFDVSYGKQMQGLLKYSSILTPNYTESCFLAEEVYEPHCSEEKLSRICERIAALGAEKVVVTSVPIIEAEMSIAVYEQGNLRILKRKQAGRSYPGTGDLFAAVLEGCTMKGMPLMESARKAHDFVSRCIAMSDACGYPVREGVMLEPNLYHLFVP